jgi:hypothetical protein
MPKKDTTRVVTRNETGMNWTPIILLGGGLGVLYYLSRPGANGQSNLVDMLGDAASNLNPLKGAGWDWSTWGSGGDGSGAGADDSGNGGGYDIVQENKSIIPPAKVIQAGVGRFVGIGARGYASSALTGRGLPGLYKSAQLAKATAPGRAAAIKTFESLGARFEARGLEQVGRVAAERVAVKGFETGAVKVTSRLVSRAVPVVGWGLALADIGADVSRVFGLHPPSWLGWSSIPAAFSTSGKNPIESWADR